VSCPSVPVESPVESDRSVDTTRAQTVAPIRVLIVDDDSRVLAALRMTLTLEADLQVVGVAGDAGTALAMATLRAPSVVLVDVLLPDERTGLDLVSLLSRRPECAPVAMSIRSTLRRAAFAAGAVAFVDKGGDIDALLTAVRAAAGQVDRPRPPDGGWTVGQ
jgi:DNA-binding NarL/FixJ family response regulator